jgi:CBS domain-containing protein
VTARHGCVVADEGRVVLGYLAPDRLAGDGLAGEAMELAPTTVRPSASPKEILEFMRDDSKRVLVTTPEGELIGIVARDAVEASA